MSRGQIDLGNLGSGFVRLERLLGEVLAAEPGSKFGKILMIVTTPVVVPLGITMLQRQRALRPFVGVTSIENAHILW